MTAALRDALGGNCKTVMIANLWPEAVHLEESASTLRFASRVRCLETSAVVNESSDPGLALARAERQIKELKQELAMRDMLRWAVHGVGVIGCWHWQLILHCQNVSTECSSCDQSAKLVRPLLLSLASAPFLPAHPMPVYVCFFVSLSGRGRIVYEDLSEGEQLELQQLVLRYLSGRLPACLKRAGAHTLQQQDCHRLGNPRQPAEAPQPPTAAPGS